MPEEVVLILITFIIVAAIGFMYYSLRVNKKDGEVSSVKEDSKKVAKMTFRYISIGFSFFFVFFFLILLESKFFEPNKGIVCGDFFVSVLAAKYVGSFLKKKLM